MKYYNISKKYTNIVSDSFINYLSLTTLAFAKQSEPELIRMTKMPGVLVAMGY
jgi:hypothetical protein